MLNKRILCCLFFALSAILITAQNCKDLVKWMDLVKQEYPEVKSLRYMNRGTIEKLTTNYFSQAYFEPYRSKSYAQLSEKTMTKDLRKIQICFVKDNLRNDPHYNWVFQNIVSNYYLAYNNSDFIKKIDIIDSKRNQLEQQLVNISKAKVSRTELLALKQSLEREYAVLLDSELREASKQIDALIAIQSAAQLDDIMASIEKLANEKASVSKLANLNQQTQPLLFEASQDKQAEFKSQRNAKVSLLLKNAVSADLVSLANQNLNIIAINEKIVAFKSDYHAFFNNKVVNEGLEQLIAKKESIIDSDLKTIEQNINKADKIGLTQMENQYLSHFATGNTTRQKISALIETRKRQLIEQQRLAQQQEKLNDSKDRVAYLEANGVHEGTMQFKTLGLNNAALFDYIYRGHFENIELDVNNSHFLMILSQYLNTFGSTCPDQLPDNKVEIMTQVCSRESVTTNGWGVETDRHCIAWKTVGTGIYADPRLYAAKMNLMAQQDQNALQNVIYMYTNPNAMGNTVDQIHKAKALKSDMLNFFKMNPCGASAIKRFAENLLAFTTQQQPVRLKGMSMYEKIKILGGPGGEQNYTKLINDILKNQSSTWAVNRYIPNTITNLRKYRSADKTQIVTLNANYQFTGILGKQTGAVAVKFKDGLPYCIYFSDFPENCKKPNSGLIAWYAMGKYGQ